MNTQLDNNDKYGLTPTQKFYKLLDDLEKVGGEDFYQRILFSCDNSESQVNDLLERYFKLNVENAQELIKDAKPCFGLTAEQQIDLMLRSQLIAMIQQGVLAAVAEILLNKENETDV